MVLNNYNNKLLPINVNMSYSSRNYWTVKIKNHSNKTEKCRKHYFSIKIIIIDLLEEFLRVPEEYFVEWISKDNFYGKNNY